MTTSLHPTRTRSGRRTWAVPALFAPALFLLTAAGLSAVDGVALGAWGWTPLDHHGVPWPSSLALLPGGWLQVAAFAGTGAALIGLAAALPRGVRAFAIGACGAGLVAAGFPLDVPLGDPTSLASWVRSWPAVVHAGGFVVAGLAGLVAVAASRRRGDIGLAALLALAAAMGGTPGWYVFLVGVFGWITLLALRASTDADSRDHHPRVSCPGPSAMRVEPRTPTRAHARDLARRFVQRSERHPDAVPEAMAFLNRGE